MQTTRRSFNFDYSPTSTRCSVRDDQPCVRSNKTSHLGIIPLSGPVIIVVAVLFSFIFIFTISFAFLGADDINQEHLKGMLDTLGTSDPGIILFGESVDVDVDEPSVTIRWSILACGDGYVLPGSTGVHQSQVCGLPSTPLYIFVDNDDKPTAIYNPTQIPFNRETGNRRSIQNLVQFDSDHVLDVHTAYLYPFDEYFLSSTIRAVDFTNTSVPIRKLTTVTEMSSFSISMTDMDSYVTLQVATVSMQASSRDLDMHIRRPGSARTITLVLFAIGWMLTHVAIGNVWVARSVSDMTRVRKHAIAAFAIVVLLPQLRNTMPDAPGMDGVLIDCIGFFPQMVISGLSVIALLLLLVVREFELLDGPPPTSEAPSSLPSLSPHYRYPASRHIRHSRSTKPAYAKRPSSLTLVPNSVSQVFTSIFLPPPSPLSPLSPLSPSMRPLLYPSSPRLPTDWNFTGASRTFDDEDFSFGQHATHRARPSVD